MDARLRVLALVTNIPGPLAARAFLRDGAAVTKIEPAQGDALAAAAPAWYAEIIAGMDVRRFDLRAPDSRERLHELIASSDVLLTAMRAGALQRLGLEPARLHSRNPRLIHVAILGEEPPHGDRAGHDLTYQARAGLVQPPSMPRTVFADLFAAERAIAAAYRALYQRERTGKGTRVEVAIAGGAVQLADAVRFGLTTRDGPLGGALSVYRLYETSDGWVALAALEPHFQSRVREALNIESLDPAALSARFAERSCAYWDDVARKHDLPLCSVAQV